MQPHSHLLLVLLCFAALFSCSLSAEVSFSNIKAFWQHTYDPDGDGSATLADFVDYFRFI